MEFKIEVNQNCRGWNKVRSCWGFFFGFLEQREPLGGTHLAVRLHTRNAWCSDSRKTLFFVYFAERESPGASQYSPARRHLPYFWALGATLFFGLRSFCKIAFLVLLTVWFRWNFDRCSITCCSSLWTVEIWFGGQ